MELWLIFALSYAFLHALVAILDRRILKNHKVDAIALSTIRYAINAAIAYLFVLAIVGSVGGVTGYSAAVLSFFYFFAGVTYFYALKFGDVSKLIPYRDAIVVLLSFFLAVILLREKFVPLDLAGALVIVTGGYIVWTDGKIIVPKNSPGLALIAGSAISLSLNSVAAKSFVLSVHPLVLSFWMYLLVAVYFILTSAAFKRNELKSTLSCLLSERKLAALTVLASLVAVSGIALLFYALSMQNATKVLPVSGTLPLFAALIGWLALKEKHGIARVFGAALILAGIYILSVG